LLLEAFDLDQQAEWHAQQHCGDSAARHQETEVFAYSLDIATSAPAMDSSHILKLASPTDYI